MFSNLTRCGLNGSIGWLKKSGSVLYLETNLLWCWHRELKFVLHSSLLLLMFVWPGLLFFRQYGTGRFIIKDLWSSHQNISSDVLLNKSCIFTQIFLNDSADLKDVLLIILISITPNTGTCTSILPFNFWERSKLLVSKENICQSISNSVGCTMFIEFMKYRCKGFSLYRGTFNYLASWKKSNYLIWTAVSCLYIVNTARLILLSSQK